MIPVELPCLIGVQVNDGELTELIVNTEYSVEKYDEVEVEFIYVHGQHH